MIHIFWFKMAHAAMEAKDAAGEAEASGPMLVTRLEACGVNATDVKKLQEAGYYTVESVSAARACARRA